MREVVLTGVGTRANGFLRVLGNKTSALAIYMASTAHRNAMMPGTWIFTGS
jgi:hypothetical protein